MQKNAGLTQLTLKACVDGQLNDMVIRKGITVTLDILIQITSFKIELLA